MTCKTYEKDLLLLAHGQLDAKGAARIRKHLSNCAPCEERFTQLAGVSLLLADAVHSARPVSFAPAPLHPSFLPARQHWLLSAFLGGCILFALLSLMRTAQSYAAPLPSMARILPLPSAISAPPACEAVPPCEAQSESARIKAQPKHHAATEKTSKPAVPAAKL